VYRSYARSFNRHSRYLYTLYGQLENTSAEAAASLRMLRQYNSQSNICAARTRTLWRRSVGEANQEIRERDVSINNIPRIFTALAAKPNGEQCLHKTLLTLYPGMN